jgi:REP element-mobilizing transposase RayT
LLVVGDGQLLVEYPPTLSVSMLVNHLKGVSSRILRK